MTIVKEQKGKNKENGAVVVGGNAVVQLEEKLKEYKKEGGDLEKEIEEARHRKVVAIFIMRSLGRNSTHRMSEKVKKLFYTHQITADEAASLVCTKYGTTLAPEAAVGDKEIISWFRDKKNGFCSEIIRLVTGIIKDRNSEIFPREKRIAELNVLISKTEKLLEGIGTVNQQQSSQASSPFSSSSAPQSPSQGKTPAKKQQSTSSSQQQPAPQPPQQNFVLLSIAPITKFFGFFAPAKTNTETSTPPSVIPTTPVKNSGVSSLPQQP